ncbi:MAG: hypothetical protein GEU28_10860 [Dehalococcoidia bacterium]|nr:hypothetical protein [Dehalococcoidia bacterium]
MTSITIRDVPSEVRDELAARASRSGRSLQEFLLAHLVDEVSHQPIEDVVARARARVGAVGSQLDVTAILADRDAERR